jgi:hypothetical protein
MSARLRVRAPGPVSGQLYETASWRTGPIVSVSCCLSATGVRFLGILARQGIKPSLRSADHSTESALWTLSGFPRSTHTRYDRIGCPLYSETSGVLRPASHPRPPLYHFSVARPCTPVPHPSPGGLRDEASTRVQVCSPARHFPSPAAPGWDKNCLGFYPELHTPPPRRRRRMSGWG